MQLNPRVLFSHCYIFPKNPLVIYKIFIHAIFLNQNVIVNFMKVIFTLLWLRGLVLIDMFLAYID